MSVLELNREITEEFLVQNGWNLDNLIKSEKILIDRYVRIVKIARKNNKRYPYERCGAYLIKIENEWVLRIPFYNITFTPHDIDDLFAFLSSKGFTY